MVAVHRTTPPAGTAGTGGRPTDRIVKSKPRVTLTIRDRDGHTVGRSAEGEICVEAANDGPLEEPPGGALDIQFDHLTRIGG